MQAIGDVIFPLAEFVGFVAFAIACGSGLNDSRSLVAGPLFGVAAICAAIVGLGYWVTT